MGSKRPPDTECAILMDATNGKTYDIEKNKEFVIGRSKSCSVIIEEIYISRRHCVIHYEEGQFFITNYNNGNGTYLNCEQLSNDNKFTVVLKHGDLISFSLDDDIKNYIYKFCLSSKMVKKPKLDECTKDKIDYDQKIGKHTQSDEFCKILKRLRSEISDIKVDKLIIANQARLQLIEFQKFMNEALKSIEQYSTEVYKQKTVVKDLVEKVSGYEDKLREQQERLNITMEHKESSLDLFKNQIHNLLENDCQCPICNEIILKAHTSQCHHTFCEGCITRWLSKNQICPVCRSIVKTTHYCLVMDNFITSLCDLLGGIAKSQRDNLKTERNSQKAQVISGPVLNPRRSRRRAPYTVTVPPNNRILINGVRVLQPVSDLHLNIPIVDLTNSFATP